MVDPSQKMSGVVNPSFTLFGVYFPDIIRKYSEGYFSQLREHDSISIVSSTLKVAPKMTEDRSQGLYSTKNKYGNTVITALGSYKNVENFQRDGQTMPTGGRCDFCKDDIEGIITGIPIDFECKAFLVNDSTLHKSVFWNQGRCCTDECAWACVKRDKIYGPGGKYSNAESYLLRRHLLTHGTDLVCRDDLCLRQKEGGPLTDEQWKSTNSAYRPNGHVIQIPVMEEYIYKDLTQ